MLCLKAEALDEDLHQSPNNDGNGSGNGGDNGGFVLPLNWGSSIHRYLQWKTGKVTSRSFSAADESCSDLEDTRPWERNGQEKAAKMCYYKYQLEQDVIKLQHQLQEETDLRLALSNAAEHSKSPSSSSPCMVPDKAKELLDSIAVLEITVSELEEKFVSLQYQLSQERNERRLVEYRLKHLPSSEQSLFHCSPDFITEAMTRPCCGEEVESNMDNRPSCQDVIYKDYFVENLWHHPNQLSEEMVQRMRDIFLFLAESSKLSSSDCMASPSSTGSHFAYSLASFSDAPNMTALARSLSGSNTFDPYGVPGKMDWSIGIYSIAVEVSWLSVGKKELEYATMALKRFRFLVQP